MRKIALTLAVAFLCSSAWAQNVPIQGIEIKSSGSSIGKAKTKLNFTGATVTQDGTDPKQINIAISGGGGGITSINGDTTAAQVIATGTSGSDFAIANSGATHTLNLPTADGTHTGKLSSANWTTFNGKMATNMSNAAALMAMTTGQDYTISVQDNASFNGNGNSLTIQAASGTGGGVGSGGNITISSGSGHNGNPGFVSIDTGGGIGSTTRPIYIGQSAALDLWIGDPVNGGVPVTHFNNEIHWNEGAQSTIKIDNATGAVITDGAALTIVGSNGNTAIPSVQLGGLGGAINQYSGSGGDSNGNQGAGGGGAYSTASGSAGAGDVTGNNGGEWTATAGNATGAGFSAGSLTLTAGSQVDVGTTGASLFIAGASDPITGDTILVGGQSTNGAGSRVVIQGGGGGVEFTGIRSGDVLIDAGTDNTDSRTVGGQVAIGTIYANSVVIGKSNKSLSLFGGTPVSQQTVSALTNSVTSGGTTDTVSNVVAASVVITNAADLVTTRNAIYQLARKVAQLEAAIGPSSGNGVGITKH